MAALSDRAVVEVFHLVFLRHLVAGATEKAHVKVKGGCNLRFFFGSPRYSEDIDLDVDVIAVHTLKKNVDKLLAPSAPLARQLATMGIGAINADAKQTATTQRWKLQLKAPNGAPLPTKVEFSRRPSDAAAELASVNAQLLHGYRLPPIQARHYVVGEALRQKIVALADRDVAQARDVFDLDLLLTQAGADVPDVADLGRKVREARERALAIDFDEYVAKVIAYLEPEQQAVYQARETWEAMQLHIVDALEKMERA